MKTNFHSVVDFIVATGMYISESRYTGYTQKEDLGYIGLEK
jgi:hypothetical protein